MRPCIARVSNRLHFSAHAGDKVKISKVENRLTPPKFAEGWQPQLV